MNRQQRSSVRSNDSASSMGSEENKGKEKVKDCCRKLVQFMCTQVGVGGLIVCYAIVGAASFVHIESHNITYTETYKAENLRLNLTDQLWEVTEKYNSLYEANWKEETNLILKNYQTNFSLLVKRGYDRRTPREIWSFEAALMFALSIFSMIGYGNMRPRTDIGKISTMVYATFGIPLYILYFLNMGKILAQTFKWIYRWFYHCTKERDDDDDIEGGPAANRKKVIVPSTACLWVITFYIGIGTTMFSLWENWKPMDATYFCVTSLCKIGIGDFVPGAVDGNRTKLVINFVYMLFGMGLVAMCYNLMREEVRVKMNEIKEDTRLCLEDLRLKFTKCFGGRGKGDEYY
jgi:potassium channel subfamily K, invertebrate